MVHPLLGQDPLGQRIVWVILLHLRLIEGARFSLTLGIGDLLVDLVVEVQEHVFVLQRQALFVERGEVVLPQRTSGGVGEEGLN